MFSSMGSRRKHPRKRDMCLTSFDEVLESKLGFSVQAPHPIRQNTHRLGQQDSVISKGHPGCSKSTKVAGCVQTLRIPATRWGVGPRNHTHSLHLRFVL